VVREPGFWTAKLHVDTADGSAQGALRIQVGETISLTPPMGWNSWNCWAVSVDEDKVLRSARAMVDSGLADHGWTYVNIDDAWQGQRGGSHHAIQPNDKFPDMKSLCDRIHALGLKAGIYSTPWHSSYAGYCGGSSAREDGRWERAVPHDSGYRHERHLFDAKDARQWAEWGFDYLKYDWYPIDVPHVEKMAHALRGCGRDIIYSLSNTATLDHASDYTRLANCWRTTGDIVDEWCLAAPTREGHKGIVDLMVHHDAWRSFNGPGHWNDPDMLVVGNVGWGPELHPSRLTREEQRTHLSLWCLWSAPLLIGCPLDDLDPWTLGLLTNDEVLALDQDPWGEQAACVWRGPQWRGSGWLKSLEDGSKALGLVNLSGENLTLTVPFRALELDGRWRIRDLWERRDLGEFQNEYGAEVAPHNTHLVRLARA